MSEQLCPGCGLRLTLGRLGPAALDYCTACKGVWLGTAALRELLVAGEEAVRRLQEQVGSGRTAPGARDPTGGCPGCGARLAKIVAPDLPRTPVFACTECRGLWLSLAALDELANSRGAHSPNSDAEPLPSPRNARGCPDCGESNPERAACCWACGRLLQGVAARSCPDCNGVVRRLPSAGAPMGGCQSCGGLWLRAGGLNELLFLSEREQAQILLEIDRLRTDRERARRPDAICPDCDVPMRRAAVGALGSRPVSSCPKCSATFVEHLTLKETVQGARQGPMERR